MNSLRLFLLSALATLFLTLPVETAKAGIFNPETFRLANGMGVAVISNHRVPVITHMVWYKVGAADEPPGKSGIAHLLEHLMFKGTEKYPEGAFSRIVARNGGQENAFTSQDYTAYYQTIAKDRLELVMRMEADRMRNLILTPETIAPEIQVVLEERRMRTENEPSAVLREQIDSALYMNYPYRIPVIGWRHETAALSVDDILTFYRQWYAPANAVLVVAGDVTADEVRPLAEKYYGTLPTPPVKARSRPSEPPQHAARRVTLKDEKVRQPSWSRAYLAPSHQSGRTELADALEVLAEALGGATGQLYRALVIEQRIAVSAGVYYDPDDMGPSKFMLYAAPRPGVKMADLERAMDAEIARVMSDGVDPKALERARSKLLAEAVYARDSLSGGARTVGSALARGLPIEQVETWPDRIRAVTKEQVDEAAKAVIRDERSVTATLLPTGDGE